MWQIGDKASEGGLRATDAEDCFSLSAVWSFCYSSGVGNSAVWLDSHGTLVILLISIAICAGRRRTW